MNLLLGCPVGKGLLGSMVRINGLFHLVINGVYWDCNPLILTFDPFWSSFPIIMEVGKKRVKTNLPQHFPLLCWWEETFGISGVPMVWSKINHPRFTLVDSAGRLFTPEKLDLAKLFKSKRHCNILFLAAHRQGYRCCRVTQPFSIWSDVTP